MNRPDKEMDDEDQDPLAYVFGTFGVLEQVLSFCETTELLAATRVCRRWKGAGREDALWEAAIRRCWKGKMGMYLRENNDTKKGNAATSNDSGGGTSRINRNTTGGTEEPRTASTCCSSLDNTIFWRSLFTNDVIQRMTEDQIRCLFGHPLLQSKRSQLEEQLSSPNLQRSKTERSLFLQRYVQLHMLDVMSDLTDEEVQEYVALFGDDDDEDVPGGPAGAQQQQQRRNNRLPRRHFFTDLYFGSYCCSVVDSRRNRMTQLELCRPFGFVLYFKVDSDEVLEDMLEQIDGNSNNNNNNDGDDDGDNVAQENYAQAAAHRNALEAYEGDRSILLYKHSTCYFDAPTPRGGGGGGTATTTIRNFRMVILDHVQHAYHPTDLQWRWIPGHMGTKVQVGPYPPLCISRRRHDWGWQLENIHVVIRSLEADGRHPTPRLPLPEEHEEAAAASAAAAGRRHRNTAAT